MKYSQSLPLPTYAQSEKYEAEGVLDFHPKDTDGEETEDVSPQHVVVTGTWCEFMLFFLSEWTVDVWCSLIRDRSWSVSR